MRLANLLLQMFALATSIFFFKLVSPSIDVDLKNCKHEWVRVESTKSQYSYLVDCANLGFERIPSGLPLLTSVLRMNGNSIISLDDQAFAGLTSLHSLDLSGNDIVTVRKSAFEDLTQLKRLDLNHNKIKCDTDIWWLVELGNTLTNFTGQCSSPRSLRTRQISSLTKEDLTVDCFSVKKLYNSSEDGEYNIGVFARDNTKTQLCVYCHGMKTHNPKEYVTLPAGVHHNYVTIKVDSSCDYFKDQDLKSRLSLLKYNSSYFTRVRIVLTSLTIITTDTTFGTNGLLKYGQPALCGSNTCTGGYAKIDLRGTHFHIKGTQKIIANRRCNPEKCSICNISNTIALSLMNPRKYPYLACTLPLGLQMGHIQNTSINASSSLHGTKPYHARLNSLRFSGWCAESLDDGEYISFDLGMTKTLSGVATQGHKSKNNWVTSYHVFYSTSGIHSSQLTRYKEFGKDIVLVGNYDSNTVATHWFQPRFRARFILIQPLSWNGNKTSRNAICLRVELYGCSNDITSYIIKPQLSNMCFTVNINGERERERIPLKMGSGCSGPNYMFTFSTHRLMHTQSGMCLFLSNSNDLMLKKDCSTSNIQFQNVRGKDGDEAFLIKDKVKCARIYNNDKAYKESMQVFWNWCLKGGFSILFMTRRGVSAFSPSNELSTVKINTNLFKLVKLDCKVYADPLATFRWSKGSQESLPYNSFENGIIKDNREFSTLTFPNITWNDRGTYYCNAWNSKGSTSKRFEVEVNAIQWWDEVPNDKKIIWGKDVAFQCISQGIPIPSVRWTKFSNKFLLDPVSVNTNHRRYQILDNSTLIIKSVHYADEGVYMCISTSPNLIQNVSASLDVYVTQKFTVMPESRHILFGKSTIFHCVSEGNPNPTIKWIINLKDIDGLVTVDTSLRHQYEILEDNSLYVKAVTFTDEGSFICVSESPGLVVNKSALLTVFVTQTFAETPSNQSVLFGYNATFNCISFGVPKPKIFWFKKVKKDGNILEDSEKYFINETSLLILDVNYSDEAEYICYSESPRLKKNVSAYLDVQVMQKFDIKPRSAKILFGKNYMLRCSSSGIPQPSISWLFQNIDDSVIVKIKNSSKTIICQNGSLLLVNVNLVLSGVYICKSLSPGYISNVSATVEIYVTQRFTKVPQSQTLLKGQDAKFYCESVGSPTPIITWKWKRSGGNSFTVIHYFSNGRFKLLLDKTLMIKDVQNEDEGYYVCVSKSPGITVNKTAHLIVFIRPLIKLSMTSKHLFIGNSISVRCNVSGDPYPYINWYKISQGKKNILNHKSPLLNFDQVEKGDQGKYICEAQNDVGLAHATFDLKVTALCFYGGENSQSIPKRYKFAEGDKATVKCDSGFQMGRIKVTHSTCSNTGQFVPSLGKCIDVNECIMNFNESGSGFSENSNIDQSDEEPEVCDYNAHCYNTIGSYYCVCDEGYVMIKDKCEFNPPGSGSNQLRFGSTSSPATFPPKDYGYLNTIYESYQHEEIKEEFFLSQLQRHSKSIATMSQFIWKIEGIKKVINFLKLAVDLADRKSKSKVNAQSVKLSIQLFGLIISDILDTKLAEEWKNINKEMNGSIMVMKYLEKYMLAKTQSFTVDDFVNGPMEAYFTNLRLKYFPVLTRHKKQTLEITIFQGDEGNVVDIPMENYVLIKDSIGVAILYQNLHKLIQAPLDNNFKRVHIYSKVFALSFSTTARTKLIKPIQLKFKLNHRMKKDTEKRYCTFWDFEKFGWSEDGCKPLNTSSSFEVICECSHLSNFAIIVPERTASKVVYLTFTLSVAVGVAACIILAFCTCMSHFCCSSYAAGDRHVIMTNITIVIVLGLLVFSGGVFLSNMKLIPNVYNMVSKVIVCTLFHYLIVLQLIMCCTILELKLILNDFRCIGLLC